MPDCFLKSECNFTHKCSFCDVFWFEIQPTLPACVNPAKADIREYIKNDHNTDRDPCKHLGSKRKCCDRLYVCRQTPGMNCVLTGQPAEGIRSCETCEKYVPITGDPETANAKSD